MSNASFKPLAITMGDAAGIGPEIIAKAYREQPSLMHQCFVVGDVGTMRRANQEMPRANSRCLRRAQRAP